MNKPTVFILDGAGESGQVGPDRGADDALPRVSGKPFLRLQLEWLAREEFTSVFFVSDRAYPDLPGCLNGCREGDISIRCCNFAELAAFGAGEAESSDDSFDAECLLIESRILFDIPLDWLINFRRTSLPAGSVCAALKYPWNAGGKPRFSLRPDWTVAQIFQEGDSRVDGYIYGGIIVAGAGSVRDILGRSASSMNTLLPDLIRAEKLFGVPFGG